MLRSKTQVIAEFKKKISNMFGIPFEEASVANRYAALAAVVRDEINEDWVETNARYTRKDERQVYYFSLEFLTGRFLENNLLCLGVRDICEEALGELGVDLNALLETEPDAGLGNGGLGRLAACFLDSMAALGYAGHGNGIRYKYGLFTQKIVDGYQVELPDNWLREANAWEIRKPDKSVEVLLGGRCYPVPEKDGSLKFIYEDALRVRAVPYDIPIVGYRNSTVNNLRLWSAEAASDEDDLDFKSFSRGDYVNAVYDRYAIEAISEVLYPDDSNYNNRELRLKQQYFFVSAGLQSIVRHHMRKKEFKIAELDKHICIHINDTHPSLAVPELMRILMDSCGLGWDNAWRVTTGIIAYTNHTIMPEALEKWPIDSFRALLPRIYMIVEEINRRFCAEMLRRFPSDPGRVARMAIIGDGVVRMANLAIVGSFSVNGVAAVHTELLKTHVLRDFYELYPEKFNNKTNGITHRRWLLKSNPALSELLCDTIGSAWIREPQRLAEFERFKNDASVLTRLTEIKRANKQRLAKIILEKNGISIDPNSIFDVQVKRIHAYKRQILNLLHVLHLYFRLQNGDDIGTPRTFIMAGKAAPSYYYAKNVIKLASEITRLLAAAPSCKGKLSLIFLENYGIALAEHIFPAAEVSEQISTASKEASGTSNMKFMMNGAVTIGTGDGANIEIRNQVGDENFISFGLSVDEVLEYYAHGNYSSWQVLNSDPRLERILAFIRSGLGCEHIPADEFINIARSLLDYNDEFFVLRDFSSYVQTQEKLEKMYRSTKLWSKMSLMNIAGSGIFSSDNTITQYANDIWHITPTCEKERPSTSVRPAKIGKT
ncbi:MAG: glycogen/starch/alpha-glucan phosphorylase [Oscillospiraceae bacterium]|nr:glycogen/starch/alpha-glucan phosphorylase [Oscillospiraceae bacterium]